MTAILQINNFVTAANQALSLPGKQSLCVDESGVGVRCHDQSRNLSAQEIVRNKQTWGVFRQSIVEVLGQKKFDWICHRYCNRFNFNLMETSGESLLPEHVELFSVGSSQLRGTDIKSLFPGKLKALSRAELKSRISRAQPFSFVGDYKDPLRIAGSPGVFSSWFFHDKLQMDKEKQLLFADVERLSFDSWLERMVKVTVNRELIEGQVIPAPGKDGRIDYYKVYRKICTGDGLIAYALRPAVRDSTLQPLIVFRSTQWALSNEDAIPAYLNDTQSRIGEMGWKAAEGDFQKLMLDPHFRKKQAKIAIAGYSLGGVHAQYFLTEHAEHVFHATFYSTPSVDDGVAEQFAEKVNRSESQGELHIQIFRTRGDVCHYVGGKHVGWGVTHPKVKIKLIEIDPENKKAHVFYFHSQRIFDNDSFFYQMHCIEDKNQLSNLLDNSKRGAEVFWYERMRRIFGYFAYYSAASVGAGLELISWIFGVKILRSSKDLDS